MKKVKFSVFADMHYYPQAFMTDGYQKLNDIQTRAVDEGCDFIIHVGDMCHGPSHLPEFMEKYNSFHIPSYNCLGNHDSDQTSYEDTLACYNMPNDYYYFDKSGYRFIVVNPNYYKQGEEYINYSLGNYFSTTGSVGVVSPKQLKWLENTIESADSPCVLFSHQSFERDADGVSNIHEVRDLIDRQNKKRKNSVILCINGHHHRDRITVLNNVIYFDLNSCSQDWIEIPHNLYPDEMNKKYSSTINGISHSLDHTINVNESIHAVITIDECTHIKIDGAEGTFFMGVTREMTEDPPFDPMGRPYVARVSSMDITLN